MKSWFKVVVLAGAVAGGIFPLRAQVAVPPPMPVYQPLAAAELDQLLGPIALYPDPLIAQMLAAATLPTQIVLADRYLNDGGDPGRIDEQPWADSVRALAHYPEVLKWMDDNLDWTTELGQAFLNQAQEVMESIQRLRQTAANFGNLQSTPQQQVVNDGGEIEIIPADPQVIYVPVYEPAQVYYQTDYGAPFITFGLGFAIGSWLNCDFDWAHHNIVVWNRAHPRPPNWWHEPPRQRDFSQARVWHPGNHPRGGTINRGDRGWDIPHNQPVVATVSRSMSDVAKPRQTPAPAVRPAMPSKQSAPPASVNRTPPANAGHYAPISRPESNGAFIGIQSSQETKNYSHRGEQSLRTMPHPPPTPPAASKPVTISRPPAAPPAGGGRNNQNPTKH
jgi:hypothetical protein